MSEQQTAPVTETKTIIKQNGIKRPDVGSQTGKLWDIADAMSGELGKPAARKDVVTKYMTEVPSANEATANTQYARWVKFHGVEAVLKQMRAEQNAGAEQARAEEKAKAQAEKEAAKAKKAADAEAKKAEREAKKVEAEAEKTRKAEERAAAKKAKEEEAARVKAEKDAAAAAAKEKPAA